MVRGAREEDPSTIYLVTVYGYVAGDIDKSALSGLSISINHYNDPPRAIPDKDPNTDARSPARDVHHSVIFWGLGSLVIIKLLSSLRKVPDTVRVRSPRSPSRPSCSFISFAAPCREPVAGRTLVLEPAYLPLTLNHLIPFPWPSNLLLKRQPAGYIRRYWLHSRRSVFHCNSHSLMIENIAVESNTRMAEATVSFPK